MINQNKKMVLNKNYKVRRLLIHLLLGIGTVSLIFAIFAAVDVGQYKTFPFAIGALIGGFLAKDKDLITFSEQSLKIRPTALASQKCINYIDIERVEVKTKKKVILYGKINGKEEQFIYLPLGEMEPSEREPCINRIKSIVNENAMQKAQIEPV